MRRNKSKLIALVMSAVMLVGLLAGCGSTTKSSEDLKGETIYGQVTSVSDSSITIDIGTQKEMEQPEGSDSDDDSDSDSSSDSDSKSESDSESSSSEDDTNNDESDSDSEKSDEDNSFLDLTGESTVVEITDSTELTKESMGGGPGGGTPPGGDNSDNGDSDSNGQPPDKPDGDDSSDSDSNSDSNSQPPEKPDGDSNSGSNSDSDSDNQPPEKSDSDSDSDSDDSNDSDNSDSDSNDKSSSESEEIELSDIAEDDVVKVVYDDDGNVTSVTVVFSGSNSGGPGESSNENIDYEAVNEYTSDASVEDETIESTGKDENAILLSEDGTKLDLSSITINRTSDNSTGGDNSSFYGVGAAILATAGEMTIEDATVNTDADGGAGVFAYGDSEITISDSTITTKQDTSGGIHVAGGGTINASNLDITTNGESSAAIRSDRGSGTINVDGGTYTSNGTGSPAIYSTANISVKNATLTATGSEAICIEGLNSITLTASDLTGNMKDDDQNDTTWNVILYQSQSGDSEEGNSTFQMSGGSLTAKNGGMFYTTNTESTFTLSDVDITYADDSEFFLQVTGNNNERGWGKTGENGADSLFTAINQKMEGNVIWDSISELDFYMTDGSSLEGAFVQDETYAGDGGDGYAKVIIDESSTWTVTGDSTVSEIECEGTIVDADGNTVTIEGTDGTTYVDGDSEYTITTDSYSDTADLSGASSISDDVDNSTTDSDSNIFVRIWNYITGLFK